MATPAMTPPPGMDSPDAANAGSPAQPGAAPSSPGAAPAPPQPGGAANPIASKLVAAIQTFREIGKAFPKAAPHISQMMEQVPHVLAAIQAQSQPGEPAAPPTG